jgi:G6PDH family F420-dependent oxidoreductase
LAPQPCPQSAQGCAAAQGGGAEAKSAAPVYGPDVIAALTACWLVLGMPAGKRLAPMLNELDGRFVLGVDSGEALNEHILGDRWPSIGVRLDMLEEAIAVIRRLHEGKEISHHGTHYEVQEARIYTLPKEPVPIYVSGFGPQATELACRIGDGYSTAMPDAELVKTLRNSGGVDKPVQAGTKVNWDRDADAALHLVHRLWGNEQLPGRLAQTLPSPKEFSAAASLVPRAKVAESVTCGPDSDKHADQVRRYLDADVDEVYVQQVGPDLEEFFAAWEKEVLPQLR